MDKAKVLFTSEISEDLMSRSDFPEFEIAPFIRVKKSFDSVKLLSFINDYRPEVIALSSKNALEGYEYVNRNANFEHDLVLISTKLEGSLSQINTHAHIAENPNSESIADLIIANFKNKRILHLNGNLRSEELSDRLKKSKINAENYNVYKTEFLSPELNIEDYQSVVFTSYSVIDSFFSKYSLNSNQTAFSIGSKTSTYLRSKWKGKIIESENSSLIELIEKIVKHYDSYHVEN